MPNIKESIHIRANQTRVFSVAQDYAVRLKWDSFSRSFRIHDGASSAAPGVRASGRSWSGVYMEVEYISVNPPDVAAMKMIKGPFFLRKFSGSWKFDYRGDKATLVTFNYHFQTKWAILSPLIDPIITFVFRRDVLRRLGDLKYAIECTDLPKRVSDFVLTKQQDPTSLHRR